MRGVDVFDDFIPITRPLLPAREILNAVLQRLDGLFERMYAPSHKGDPPSIAPEKLARSMILQLL